MDVNRIPVNIDYAVLEIVPYEIQSWTPLPDGKGPCTQVHMTINIRNSKLPLVIRFKSKQAVRHMIDALNFHMNDVWPAL